MKTISTMIKRLTPIIILFFITLTCFSENLTDDIVILNDEIDMVFIGENSDFIYYEVHRKTSYKVYNEQGIKKISEIILPENFDPVMINHFAEKRNYEHVYSGMKVDYFDAVIVNKNGEKKNAQISNDEIRKRIHMLAEDYYGNYYKYSYKIENIEPGDVITIDYQFNVKFTENLLKLSSNRIFFNSDIPKEKYRLTITHHKELVVESDYINGAEPDSVIQRENNKTIVWTREDLAPALNEPGSRPYMELPHVIFTVRPYNFLYTVPHTFEERLTPLYTLFTRAREKRHFKIALAVLQGVNTRQYSNIKKFVEAQTSMAEEDSSGFNRILQIQNTIADDFTFEDDLPYFTMEDRRDPRMGDFLAGGKIRDIARNEIYLALIKIAGLNYFTTYICDNRAGILSDKFLVPMHYSDVLYTVLLENNEAAIIYPKKSRFGYYLNEFPFFYEGSRGRLVHINDYLNMEVPINEEFREIIMPTSGISENTRNSRFMGQVSLNDKTVVFNGQVSLRGQFSTMTRGLYLYDFVEPGINPFYGKKVWDLNDEVNVNSKSVDIKSKEAPYTTAIRANYIANNIVIVEGDKAHINLNNWFSHIIYEDFSAEGRVTDFYFDFPGRDSYSYLLQFDKDVKLESDFKRFEINNESVSCVINVEQLDSKSIKLETYLAVGDIIESENVVMLEEVFKALQRINESELALVIE